MIALPPAVASLGGKVLRRFVLDGIFIVADARNGAFTGTAIYSYLMSHADEPVPSMYAYGCPLNVMYV